MTFDSFLLHTYTSKWRTVFTAAASFDSQRVHVVVLQRARLSFSLPSSSFVAAVDADLASSRTAIFLALVCSAPLPFFACLSLFLFTVYSSSSSSYLSSRAGSFLLTFVPAAAARFSSLPWSALSFIITQQQQQLQPR